MKKYLSILLILLSTILNAQTHEKKIIITQAPKTVPIGKVWKLEHSKPTIVQLSEGTLKSGNLCNALFLSRPGVVLNINKGNYYKPDGFGIIFRDFEKVPYTNELTYTITPISFVDDNFNYQELSSDSAEKIGTKEIEFKAGETVFVGGCFITIELTEYNMSDDDLEIERKKLALIEKEKNRLKSNFVIPIIPEKYVEPGTKPELKDNFLNLIIFSSEGVLFKRPGEGFAFDGVSVWTMTLNIEEFSLRSSNGINKTYKVIDIRYNDALRMQEFLLGDFDGKQTHSLQINWSNSYNQYFVLLSSIDRSEEFQFQNTQAIKKQ